MLTLKECKRIFKEHLPSYVRVYVVTTEKFVGDALNNPWIRRQIEVGIYDEKNIYTDFLSCAVTYSDFKRMDFCYELFCEQARDIPDDIVRAYITQVALHEAHHFHEHKRPRTVLEHAEAEHECIEDVARNYPDLWVKVEEFEATSPVFQRVYERMRAIA